MTDNNAKVEQTFALLKDAKQHESQSDFWQATEKFVEAHHLLEALASDETEKATDETERIAKLYAAKADEYRKQSRSCLIRAMEQEKKTDEEEDSSGTVYACTLLDNEQAKARNHAFSVLFSRPIGSTVLAEIEQPRAEPNDDGNIENEDDLAARLRALNQSLPSEFKTTSERMSDVNKGLHKLGVSSVYTSQTNHSRFEDELPKDEDEQIDEIIAQVKDEAALRNNAKKKHEDSSNDKAKENDYDDNDFFSEDDDEDDDSEQDALLDDEQLAMKIIQKHVVKAQVQLAELLALLDQARSKKAKDELDEDEAVYNNDDDSDDSLRDVQQHDVAFLLLNGKRKLKSARRNMNKALDEWQDLSLS